VKKINIAFIGNPNTGKTTLINTLSNSKFKIGNWPGVTVAKKEAFVEYKENIFHLVDLPGLYNLSKISDDEKITTEYIEEHEPDLYVNIIDSTNLRTNLLLTIQLLKEGVPVLLVFNFWNDLNGLGKQIDLGKLEKVLGVECISLEANQTEYREKLLEKINCSLKNKKRSTKVSSSLPARAIVDIIVDKVEKKVPTDKVSVTDKIDQVVLNDYVSVPIFFIVFFLLFKITFDGSAPLIDWIDQFINGFVAKLIVTIFTSFSVPKVIGSLVIDGFLVGVGTVLSFVPLMMFLYFFISFLEESGYIARVAFIMDKFMRPLGLQGKAFIPLLIGLGCNVPAIYSTRTLEKKNDRKVTAAVTSFVSCGAKLPIYILFSYIFFPKQAVFVTLSLYLLGMLVAISWAWILNRFIYKDASAQFVIELPTYRWPSMIVMIKSAFAQVKGFVKRAGTVITVVVVMIWALSNLPYGVSPRDSILGVTSRSVSPIFIPLGWGNSWQATASVIPGFLAKEAVVGSLATAYETNLTESTNEALTDGFIPNVLKQCVLLYEAVIDSIKAVFGGLVPGVFITDYSEDKKLSQLIKQDMTPLMAYSYMVFNLLLISCVAVISAIRQEFGQKFLWFVILMTVSTAYVFSFIVYQGGLILGFI